uniref:RNA-directed DNA polymerase n=1 Tax=Anopheles epiroticus TaxID=199890 RepID=A0A182PW13_9DIPT
METVNDGVETLAQQTLSVHAMERFSGPRTRRYCFRCGSSLHLANKCEHKTKVCAVCKKVGHLQRVCFRKTKAQGTNDKKRVSRTANLVEHFEESDSQDTDEDQIHKIDILQIDRVKDNSKIFLNVQIGRSTIKFEVDSGSPVTLLNEKDKEKYLKKLKLTQTDVELQSYYGGKIGIIGVAEVKINTKDGIRKLRLFIVEGKRQPLLGREWMRALNFDWNKILNTKQYSVDKIIESSNTQKTLKAILDEFPSVFSDTVRYRKSKDHGNADGVSRLPLKEEYKDETDEVDMLQINQIESLPVQVKELGEHTMRDSTVKDLVKALRTGRTIEGRYRFGIDQTEFTLQNDCLMRGIRVYIPEPLRKAVLKELHMGHFGISRMKSLARTYCWWESIDRDIEETARDCVHCARIRKNPPKVQRYSWEQPSEPFQRIHIDFAGPFLGLNFLIIVDAGTKWPEVKIISDITTETTIDKLREFFATFGLPAMLVSDRGTQFTSELFQTFLKKNGIIHRMGAPYHPATNGQAERFVQVFKEKLKALKCQRSDVNINLQNILWAYRRTIHPSIGKSPAMAVFGRQLKSRLDLMIPGTEIKRPDNVKGRTTRSFEVEDRVAARDFMSNTEKWRFGKVTEKIGILHYKIHLDDGRLWKRHIDQLRPGPGIQWADNKCNNEQQRIDLSMYPPVMGNEAPDDGNRPNQRVIETSSNSTNNYNTNSDSLRRS